MATEELDCDYAGQIIGSLLKVDERSSEPLTLFIACPGGSPEAFMAIYAVIKTLRNKMKTFAAGDVSSSALLLLAVGEKGSRRVSKGTTAYLHPVEQQFDERSLTSVQARKEMEHTAWLEAMMCDALAEHAKLSSAEIRALRENEQYLEPAELVESGFADEVIG